MLQGVFQVSCSRPTDPDTLESSGAALAHVLILKLHRSKGTPLWAGNQGMERKVGGAAESWITRAAIHGWKALHTEQAVSYDTARSFYADLEGQPVRKNSLRRGQSKRSSRGELSNVEAAGTVTCRRQHLPVRREVRPEEVRCLRPTSAVHSRPLPAAVRVVCPRSALLTHCIAVVWQ
jgi:hypothetical protein